SRLLSANRARPRGSTTTSMPYIGSFPVVHIGTGVGEGVGRGVDVGDPAIIAPPPDDIQTPQPDSIHAEPEATARNLAVFSGAGRSSIENSQTTRMSRCGEPDGRRSGSSRCGWRATVRASA